MKYDYTFKRSFDVFVASLLIVILLPVFAFLSIIILLMDGKPIFYISERMMTPTIGFKLFKFRTMTPVTSDSGVSGGNKENRVTRTGKYLRASRLDEIPQLLNVLRGEISFVGPRPPLRLYVERFPDIYNTVLQSRPGITGLASVYFHKHEENILKRCDTPYATDLTYSRVCVPRKAKLDLIYQRNASLCFDVSIMFKTVFSRFK